VGRTFKCKYCTSPEDLEFPPNWRKGKKLINALTGKPHYCQRNKKVEISASHWKQPTKRLPLIEVPNTPTFYICGNHKTELSEKSFEYLEVNGREVREKTSKKYHCDCLKIGLSYCQRFCTKCQEHPRVIYVTDAIPAV